MLLYTYKYDSFDGRAQEELTTSNFPVTLGTQPPIHPRVKEETLLILVKMVRQTYSGLL